MSGRRHDDYDRGPASTRHSTSRGSTRDSRDTYKDDRPRKEPRSRRIAEEEDTEMDLDEPQGYSDRHGVSRSDKYPATSTTRMAQTGFDREERHRRDRSPDDEPRRRDRITINADTDRGNPPLRPGTDRDFWIPNEGIDRDVITYEITRYLGQDALVRPGKNEVCSTCDQR